MLCDGRESNPGQLLGRQLCSPLYHHRTKQHEHLPRLGPTSVLGNGEEIKSRTEEQGEDEGERAREKRQLNIFTTKWDINDEHRVKAAKQKTPNR